MNCKERDAIEIIINWSNLYRRANLNLACGNVDSTIKDLTELKELESQYLQAIKTLTPTPKTPER